MSKVYSRCLFRYLGEGNQPQAWSLSTELFGSVEDVRADHWNHELYWPVIQNADGTVTVEESALMRLTKKV